jgi:hypothetical protein
MREGSPGNLDSMNKAADEAALGPFYERPHGVDLRKELTRTLTPPGSLELSAADGAILVAIDGHKPLSLTPGEPHSRTDVYGTAEIDVEMRKEQLTVTERYDRKRQYTPPPCPAPRRWRNDATDHPSGRTGADAAQHLPQAG